MAFSLALFLSSDRTTTQGEKVLICMIKHTLLSFVYSLQSPNEATSIGLSFHCLSGSVIRRINRLNCSSRLTENQNLIRVMSLSTSIFSNEDTCSMNCRYCSGVQNPIAPSHPCSVVPRTVKKYDFTPESAGAVCIAGSTTRPFLYKSAFPGRPRGHREGLSAR